MKINMGAAFSSVADSAVNTGLYILYRIGGRMERLADRFEISSLGKVGRAVMARADYLDDQALADSKAGPEPRGLLINQDRLPDFGQ